MRGAAAGNLHRGDFLAEFWMTLPLGVALDEDVGAIAGPAWGEFPGRFIRGSSSDAPPQTVTQPVELIVGETLPRTSASSGP